MIERLIARPFSCKERFEEPVHFLRFESAACILHPMPRAFQPVFRRARKSTRLATIPRLGLIASIPFTIRLSKTCCSCTRSPETSDSSLCCSVRMVTRRVPDSCRASANISVITFRRSNRVLGRRLSRQLPHPRDDGTSSVGILRLFPLARSELRRIAERPSAGG